MMTDDFEPNAIARRVMDLLGGREKARALMDDEHQKMNKRWNQDVVVIGRILRAHLYVEHYLTEFIEKANPRLGSLDDARLTFAQKLHLLEESEALRRISPGIKKLNAIRNRLAHRLDAHVTREDADVFLSDVLFKSLRDEVAKPDRPSNDPLEILEEFARHASSTLDSQFSPVSIALVRAIDEGRKATNPETLA